MGVDRAGRGVGDEGHLGRAVRAPPGILTPHPVIVIFFSVRWEIGVRWHIMIPPDNWAEIYLRERFVEVQPTRGFKLDSWTPEPTDIYPIDVTEPIWR